MVLCTYRWYSPDMGRWLTRDPISYSGGHNLYGYCGGDPVNWIDPSGHLAQLVRVNGLIGIPDHYFVRYQDANGIWVSIGFWPYTDPDGNWWARNLGSVTGCPGQLVTPDFDENKDLTVIEENINPLVAKRLGCYIHDVKKWNTCDGQQFHTREHYNYFNLPAGMNCYGGATTIYHSAIHNELFPLHEFKPLMPNIYEPIFGIPVFPEKLAPQG